MLRPLLDRADHGYQRSATSNQPCGSLPHIAADDVEHEIDSADVFKRVVLEVDELLRTEVEGCLTVRGAPRTDDVRARLSRELRHHRPDGAGGAVREHTLSRAKVAVLEQSLPRGET